MVPEVTDVCAEAFDLTKAGVSATAVSRQMAIVTIKKRMGSECARWLARLDSFAIRGFKIVFHLGPVSRVFSCSVAYFGACDFAALSQRTVGYYDCDPWRIRGQNVSVPACLLNFA